MKLTYRSNLNYEHRIDNTPGVVEERCKIDHPHPNVEIIVKVETTSEFLDFKTIKDRVEEILENYRGINITDEFGITTVENLATHLENKISSVLKRPISLEIWETDKYGVEISSSS